MVVPGYQTVQIGRIWRRPVRQSPRPVGIQNESEPARPHAVGAFPRSMSYKAASKRRLHLRRLDPGITGLTDILPPCLPAGHTADAVGYPECPQEQLARGEWLSMVARGREGHRPPAGAEGARGGRPLRPVREPRASRAGTGAKA